MVNYEKDQGIPQTWAKMGKEQLRLYASELAELHRQEKDLRQDLSERNEALEKRIQELSALNTMFRKHLDMRLKTEEALKHLVDGIKKSLNEAEIIRDSATPN